MKPTKAELEARNATLEKQNGLLLQALHLTGRPGLARVVVQGKTDGETTTLLLHAYNRHGDMFMNGGIVVSVWHLPGQSDTLEVFALEDLYAQTRMPSFREAAGYEYCDAIERLYRARNQAYAASEDARKGA